MADYNAITQADFDNLLGEIVNETRGGLLLHIPGIYEILSEEFNNEVLKRWAQNQEIAEEPA